MSQIEVSHVNVPTIINNLKCGEWLTPEFQRDFVWGTGAVIGLISSIIDSKPIGMVTLWQQEDLSDLELEHISVSDFIHEKGETAPRYFGNKDDRPGRYFVILDGKQRSTSIALAFGGLRAEDGKYKHSGRYYLDVTALDPNDRVKYFTEKEVRAGALDTLSVSISKGLFPLAVENPDEVYQQWMGYTQKISSPTSYPENKLPPEEELQRRIGVLQNAFNGIINTKLAVYTVPQTQSLGEICEIFETLNTTGTKVSTIDLIHSWLYSDTVNRKNGPILLRQEIDELGDYDGVIGWSSSKNRPELIAQIVAAIHIALDKKPEPRRVSGKKITRITSIKSPDLLAIPDRMWSDFFSKKEVISQYFKDMQDCVAGGYFSMAQAPYPAAVCIYISLRWYLDFDSPEGTAWDKTHLNSIFRPFFWRNALSNRYDQGFLTKVSTDIKDVKKLLNSIEDETSHKQWGAMANSWLEKNIPKSGLAEKAKLICSDGKTAGALQKASLLLLFSRATLDLMKPAEKIYNAEGGLQLYQIFNRDWLKNNVTLENEAYFDKTKSDADWINSPANLVPMSRTSNLQWKKLEPISELQRLYTTSQEQKNLLNRYFISAESIGLVSENAGNVGDFFEQRSKAITDEINSFLDV